MTKDRLQDLQTVVSKSRDEDDASDWHKYGAVVNTALDIEVDENAGYMDHFFREVEQVRSWINDINEHITEMRLIHNNILSSPRPDEQMKQRLDSRTETVKQIAKKVNENLKCLERRIWQEEEDLEDSTNKSQIPAGLRIRKTQHATTLKLFVDAITQFNLEQVDYKEKCEKRIKRVVTLAKADITDEKLQELLEQGNYGSVFNGDIITETKEARRVLEDVQLRHEELLKLEKSITELRDLFVEMALLVEQQGDMINNIERHVEEAGEHVEKAKTHITKATKYQRKLRVAEMRHKNLFPQSKIKSLSVSMGLCKTSHSHKVIASFFYLFV
ncbi:syntaxin-like isoform X2 [Lycorma delicatula]|uniref:syntaxin-like isoform X2 n=1 Tax=Lycorma delicatula TaxID=130591 RepID=UPI003F51A373